jgi:hypothetical protein
MTQKKMPATIHASYAPQFEKHGLVNGAWSSRKPDGKSSEYRRVDIYDDIERALDEVHAVAVDMADSMYVLCGIDGFGIFRTSIDRAYITCVQCLVEDGLK